MTTSEAMTTNTTTNTDEALRAAFDLLGRIADAAPASLPEDFDSIYDKVQAVLRE